MITPINIGHDLLVMLHAVAAIVALTSGIVVLLRGRGLTMHTVAMMIMAGSLPISMTLGWRDFSTGSKITFAGLAVLAMIMLGQAFRARRIRAQEFAAGQAWDPGRGIGISIGPKFVRVVGFNVIALITGGAIVPVLRAGGGLVGVIIAVAACVSVSHLLVERRRSRVMRLATDGA